MKPASISNWFDKIASRKGAKKAVTFIRNSRAETVLSYSQLSHDIDGFAGTLLGLGIKKGDRVMMIPVQMIPI